MPFAVIGEQQIGCAVVGDIKVWVSVQIVIKRRHRHSPVACHADARALTDVLECSVAAVAIENVEFRFIGERPGIGNLRAGGHPNRRIVHQIVRYEDVEVSVSIVIQERR